MPDTERLIGSLYYDVEGRFEKRLGLLGLDAEQQRLIHSLHFETVDFASTAFAGGGDFRRSLDAIVGAKKSFDEYKPPAGGTDGEIPKNLTEIIQYLKNIETNTRGSGAYK